MATNSQVKRTSSLFLSLILIVAALTVYQVMIRGELRAIEELRSQLVSKKELLADQQAVTDQVKNLIVKFKSVAALEESVGMAIPKGQNLPALMRGLNAIFLANNIDARIILISASDARRPEPNFSSPTGGLAVSPPRATQINFQFTGQYEELKTLLRGIERNVRIMDIVGLKLSDTKNSGAVFENLNPDTVVARGPLNFDVTLRAYFEPERGLNNSNHEI